MKEEIKKIFKDRLFVLFCVFFAVCAGCTVAVSLINYSEHRYISQAFFAVFGVSLFFLIRTIIKIYKKFFKENPALLDSIKKKIAAFFYKIDDAVRKILHMRPRSAYFGGKDEKRSEYGVFKKREYGGAKTVKRVIKWKSLEENRAKIRFMFAKAVNDGIAAGYKYKYSHTARRLKADLAKTDRSKLLFDLYEDVRYTNHMTEIEDETIEYLLTPDPVEDDQKKKRRKN